GNAYKEYKAYQTAKDAYKTQTTTAFLYSATLSPTQSLQVTLAASITFYNPFAVATNKANLAYRIAGGVFAVQLIHAYYSGRAYEIRHTAFDFSVVPEHKGVFAGGRYVAYFD